MYQEEEDVNLFVSKIHTSKTVFEYIFLQARRPGHDKRFRTIGESIILGAAAVATAGDKNTPQLVRNTSHAKPRIFENYIESHENNTHTVGLAEVLEDSCKFIWTKIRILEKCILNVSYSTFKFEELRRQEKVEIQPKFLALPEIQVQSQEN